MAIATIIATTIAALEPSFMSTTAASTAAGTITTTIERSSLSVITTGTTDVRRCVQNGPLDGGHFRWRSVGAYPREQDALSEAIPITPYSLCFSPGAMRPGSSVPFMQGRCQRAIVFQGQGWTFWSF